MNEAKFRSLIFPYKVLSICIFETFLHVTVFVFCCDHASLHFDLFCTIGVDRKLKVKNIESILHMKVNTNIKEMVLQMAYAGIDAKVTIDIFMCIYIDYLGLLMYI
jgi:hypothetical protein